MQTELEALRQAQLSNAAPSVPVAVARLNVGLPIVADDGGIDWVARGTSGTYDDGKISITSHNNYTYSSNVITAPDDIHESIPDYISDSVFDQIFRTQSYGGSSVTITVSDLESGSYRFVLYNAQDALSQTRNDYYIDDVYVGHGDVLVDFGDHIGGAYSFDTEVTTGELNFRIEKNPDNSTWWAFELLKL